MDENGDGDSKSKCIGRLFDSVFSDSEEAVAATNELSAVVLPESDDRSKLSDHVNNFISESEAPPKEEHANAVSEPHEENKEPSPSASSSTREDIRAPYPLVTDCLRCRNEYNYRRESINVNLPPLGKWSIRLAPLQIVDFSMTGIRILPLQAS